jgi:predicted transcriptional regulator
MPQQFSVRLDDDLSAWLQEEAEKGKVTIAELLRQAAAQLATRQAGREQDTQLVTEVLRTRALLRRFIEHQTDEEMAEQLVETSRKDVAEYLKKEGMKE